MQTTYIDRLPSFIFSLKDYVLYRLIAIKGLTQTNFSDLTKVEKYLSSRKIAEIDFSFMSLQQELRKNILIANNQHEINKYLVYILKNYTLLRMWDKTFQLDLEEAEKNIVKKKKPRGLVPYEVFYQYPTIEHLVFDCYYKAEYNKKILQKFIHLVEKEFELPKKDWEKLFISSKGKIKVINQKDVEVFFGLPSTTSGVKRKMATESPKLIWNGNKNLLYSVIRQLKKEELITNSYEEIADFLISNVNIFLGSSRKTTAREMSRKEELPKKKKVELYIEKQG